jgi:hypothetical protein
MSLNIKTKINNDGCFQGTHPPAKPSNIGHKEPSRTPNKKREDKQFKR